MRVILRALCLVAILSSIACCGEPPWYNVVDFNAGGSWGIQPEVQSRRHVMVVSAKSGREWPQMDTRPFIKDGAARADGGNLSSLTDDCRNDDGKRNYDIVISVLNKAIDSKCVANPELTKEQGPVYLCFRRNGVRQYHAWIRNNSWIESIKIGFTGYTREMIRRNVQEPPTTVEVNLTHSFRKLQTPKDQGLLGNAHVGVYGLKLICGSKSAMWSPSEMIARNVTFARAINIFADECAKEKPNPISDRMDKFVFRTEQFLVDMNGSPVAHEIFRGDTEVQMSEVNKDSIQGMADAMVQWLASHVDDDGRLTYKYWPSRGEESTANNTIRQFMSTVALQLLAKNDRYTKTVSTKAVNNLRYNLGHYYKEERGLGLIEYDGSVKLGAIALAAMAVRTSSVAKAHDKQAKELLNAIYHLHRKDGSFGTFYRPANRNDNQNFYPGEAVLLLAQVFADTHDKEVLSHIDRAFKYYRSWHIQECNRNPAFVAWWTRACYIMWKETGDAKYSAFIFLMNDWLLDMQQWDSAPYDDLRGRFYNPEMPSYGPPHVSSTGVYLEGLVDAFLLARETRDLQRMGKYRIAILRGLRSIMQHQFRDDIDMYYISKHNLVYGGIRTNAYDNEIRVDNVQHCLMATLQVLASFNTNDYSFTE